MLTDRVTVLNYLTILSICALLFVAGLAGVIGGVRAELTSVGSGLLMLILSPATWALAGIGIALAYKMLDRSDSRPERILYGILYGMVTLFAIGLAVVVVRELLGS